MSRTTQPRQRSLAAFVLLFGMAGFTYSAMANRGPDDRRMATQILAQQAVSGSAAPINNAIGRAQNALRRADEAHRAGDARHALRLEGLAREWAEMAQDINRATRAERHADNVQRAAASASVNIRKTQALLETLIAQRARAQGELQQLQATSNAPIASAALSAALLPRPSFSTKPAPKGSQ